MKLFPNKLKFFKDKKKKLLLKPRNIYTDT